MGLKHEEINSLRTIANVTNRESIINNIMKSQEDVVEMDTYNDYRREHIAISVLFGIGYFFKLYPTQSSNTLSCIYE